MCLGEPQRVLCLNQFPHVEGDAGFSSGSEDDEPSPMARDYAQDFGPLLVEVNTAIDELGGEVAPKLNWSSPLDAAWILPGRCLKCSNADEVGLQLLVFALSMIPRPQDKRQQWLLFSETSFWNGVPLTKLLCSDDDLMPSITAESISYVNFSTNS